MKIADKLNKVSESLTINRYDNGFMIEVNGRNEDNDWKSAKIMCVDEAQLIDVLKEALAMPLDD